MSAAPTNDPLLAGVPVVDGYPVLEPCVLYRRLGQGGMGAVYLAHHTRLECEVAVKCLRIAGAHDEERAVQRFRREARLAAAVRHPNLVGVYDVLEAHGLHYMVLEYVHGETARERVRRKGALEPAEACAIVRATAEGLAAAHERRIVHRDVKPDNVLISVTSQVKLADLGLAKALEQELGEPTATIGSVSMGTPSYMPPEQWEDAREVTPAADVYALGAMLYFLLVGTEGIPAGSARDMMRRVLTEPFPDPRAARPEISSGLTELIADCTRKEAGERPADATELLRRLAQVAPAPAALEGAPEDGAESASVISPPPYRTILRATKQFEGGAASDSKHGGVRVFRTACPACGETLTLLPEHRGKRVRCKKCSEMVRVPGSSEAAVIEEVVPSPAGAQETIALTRTFERPSRARERAPRRANTAPVVWLLGGVLLAGAGYAVFGRGRAQASETQVAQETKSGSGAEPVAPTPGMTAGKAPVAPDPEAVARQQQVALEQQRAVEEELRQRGEALSGAKSADELRRAVDAAAETCRKAPEACAKAGLGAAREKAAKQLAQYDEMIAKLVEVEERAGTFESFGEIEELEGPLSKMKSGFAGDGVEQRVANARVQLDAHAGELARRAKGVAEEVGAVLALEQLADAVEDPARKASLRASTDAPLRALDARLARKRDVQETGELVVALAPRPERESEALDERWKKLLADRKQRTRDAASLEDALVSLGELDRFAEELAKHAPESTGRKALLACGDPALDRLDQRLDELDSVLTAEDLVELLAKDPPASYAAALAERYDRVADLVREEGKAKSIKQLPAFLQDLQELGERLPEGALRKKLEAVGDELKQRLTEEAQTWERRLADARSLLEQGKFEPAASAFGEIARQAGKGTVVAAWAGLGKVGALHAEAAANPYNAIQCLTTARQDCDFLYHDWSPSEDPQGRSIAAHVLAAKARTCRALALACEAKFKAKHAPRDHQNAVEAKQEAEQADAQRSSRYGDVKLDESRLPPML